MKQILLVAIIILFSGSSFLFAQISQGGKPPSFKYNLKTNIDRIELQPRQMSYVLNEEEKLAKDGSLSHIGYSLSTDISIDNSGTWTDLPDGGKIWQLQIKAPSALALVVYYDNFKLPVGTKLFLYNEDKTQVIGAFNWYNNDISGYFANELIYGDIVNIEYYEPERVFSKPLIHINQIGYIYKGVSVKKNTNWTEPSEPCEVNINCSPVGDNWQDEKQGVARILVTTPGGQGWCTGSLVNNTNQDCTPYFLTAWHCYEDATATQLNQWIFYFNYEASGCATPTTEPTSNSMTGASLKAAADITGGSDFILLQLNQTVPTDYNPYMNGWNRANSVTGPGVGIHHPNTSIKKISTYNTTTTATYSGSATNAHWEIFWVSNSNGWGVTEGGSSGSPIFDANSRIVGTLTGGSSNCSAQSSPDYYGKVYYHWDQNAGGTTTQLKTWLDPAGTNPTTLDGKYCVGTTTICDTLHYPLKGTPALYGIQAPNTGYVSGNNSYGDLAKADYFATYDASKKINGVYIYFGVGKGGSSNVPVKVWNNTGTAGAPGTVLATQNVSLTTIKNDVIANYATYVTFSTPVIVSTPFYVGVTLPTTAGDTIAIISNTDGDTNPGTAWEQSSGNNWYPFSDATNSWSLNVQLAIWPVMCPTTGILSIEEKPVAIFPNPANNEVYIILPYPAGEKVNISIFDIYGKLCKQTEIYSSMEGPVKVDLYDLQSGIYLLQIESAKGKFVEKISVIK